MIRRRDAGVTLFELMIAMAIMVLALIALMSSVFSSSRLADSSRESVLAYEAARAKIEEMRTYTKCSTYNNLFTYYSVAANKDTYFWNATTKLPNFPGLNPIKVGGVEQPILQVIFPVGITGHLSEAVPSIGVSPSLNYNSTKMGMPRDLNRNGLLVDVGTGVGTVTVPAGDLDVAYNLLPVLIRVQWEGMGRRTTQIEVVTYMSEK